MIAAMTMVETGAEADWDSSLAAMQPILSLSHPDYVKRIRMALDRVGIVDAVRDGNSRAVFERLFDQFQYQGVSDAAAQAFVAKHGRPHFTDLYAELSWPPDCQKLSSYWAFSACGYRKGQQTCAKPDLLHHCYLPQHQFRNGRLSQSAYSFFLFVRDICDGDLVSWIDGRLASADDGSAKRTAWMRDAVLEPMTNIYGVSRKVLSMALSDLLLGVDPERERWVTTGASMIAIDTLVHNFLVRTGILGRHGKKHSYGPACYGAGGCAEIIEMIADHVDARDFGSEYPRRFPRFIQWSIWSFCAQQGWNVCNGNTINDRQRCANVFCPVFRDCARVRLG